MPKPTIYDLADAAGVSIKSVSRVINGEPHVSAKLRAKVETAMSQLGYIPNPAARSMGGSKAFAIAVLFNNPSPAYVLKVQEGAYAACHEAGYHLVMENIGLGGDPLSEIEGLLRRPLDGLLLTQPLADDPDLLDRIEHHGVRYARIAPVIDPSRCISVTMDDRKAMTDIAHHLWSLGHRRIGLVNGPADYGVSELRRQGFLDASFALGGFDIIERPGAFSFMSGMEAGLALLDADPRPTAIVALNDDMAAGIYAAAAQRKLTIPDDLSIMGFDDSWIAQNIWPPLTTINQPIAEMARSAARLLIAPDDKVQPWPISFEHHLAIRGSTASLR